MFRRRIGVGPRADSQPSISQIDAAWHNSTLNGWSQSYYDQLTSLAQSIGKPVIFTESGVASYVGANDRNDFPNSVLFTSSTDYSEQSNWYESFFNTWCSMALPKLVFLGPVRG